MVPGNIIEWVYKQTDELITERETLWSTPMKRWVPIGSGFIHTLISIDSEQITWMNEEGLFHARMDDTQPRSALFPPVPVVPREKLTCDLVT